jgi:uncharacterized membrane protein YecN with MAPEG domain
MSIGATEEVEWANVIAISVVALVPSVAGVLHGAEALHRRCVIQRHQGMKSPWHN